MTGEFVRELLGEAESLPCYIHPFTPLRAQDTYQALEERISKLRKKGVRSMNLLWSGAEAEGYEPFNSESYWMRIGWAAQLCRQYGMTFMLQDAAPFPTGRADGFLEQKEYAKNKWYLGERHLDVKGPLEHGAFLVSELCGSLRSTDQEHGFALARPFAGDRLLAVVAVRRDGEKLAAETALDLTDEVEDGLLSWAVPDGIWRIFVIFETQNDGGRRYYINLQDEESVAVNIEAIYEPHYEHLKEEIGKTWIGFFYDEAEIGNLLEYCTPIQPGHPRNLQGESMALPWSGETARRWKRLWRGEERRVLPFLWEEDEQLYHRVRFRYMDMISSIVRETFNGQMHRWCRAHGLQYIGHNLEDENTHCSLATGPVHFFRMQANQDAAGIDLIGGQLMPGKDFRQAWYGSSSGDGEFYHYGIAKLASSAAHIDPNKKGRSFCEVFAVYGAITGSRLRKYVYDHLLVNGINEMIPAPAEIPGADEAACRTENGYVGKMCHLLHHAKPVIQTAVLYHAEAEWYQGAFQRFQEPGRELARHQISYDVIPADVFTKKEWYGTDTADGLCINGHRYEALIIPAAEAVPEGVRWFLEEAKRTGFPVFYCDRAPAREAESGQSVVCSYGETVPLSELADRVRSRISRDMVSEAVQPELRCAHYCAEEGNYYLLFNEGKATWMTMRFPVAERVYELNLMRRQIQELKAAQVKNGKEILLTLPMETWEMKVLLLCEEEIFVNSGVKGLDGAAGKGMWIHQMSYRERVEAVRPRWHIQLQSEAMTEGAEGILEEKTTEDKKDSVNELVTEELVNINGADYFPRFVGRVIYTADVFWNTPPTWLNLGEVYERCEVFVNGHSAGRAQNTPYRFRISEAAQSGKNELRIEVDTGIARRKGRDDQEAFGNSMSATVYNSLEPGGMLGPVSVWYAGEGV
ncbi:MAG: hypothetical protein Q4C60_06310 [Eubacteriales bacterium]|nr:hypothetical protein [Eubacteriales bacterium]